jgi:hypothetical protein
MYVESIFCIVGMEKEEVWWEWKEEVKVLRKDGVRVVEWDDNDVIRWIRKGCEEKVYIDYRDDWREVVGVKFMMFDL